MIRILHGDCTEMLATLPSNSVHCVVTSPPYYGLRDYGTAQWDGGDAGCDHTVARTSERDRVQHETWAPPSGWTNRDATPPRQCKCGAIRIDRQIGLEATPDEYLTTMVAVFREVRRVLRDDGTCWVNIGDSYASTANGRSAADTKATGNDDRTFRDKPFSTVGNGYKPKDLLMMPARLALALQADGWWIRSDIIWHKPNPMPESCTDRPTSSHEHVFLLTKSARYFYDADAIAEPALQPTATRSCRNVWTIATAPYSEAHFATFPPALAERCIRAGTSERGCCAACGAPWVRQIETHYTDGGPKHTGNATSLRYIKDGERTSMPYKTRHDTTAGWSPSCAHDAPVAPCTVLDCFAGAFTAPMVADRLQRHAIGIELNPAYCGMARARIDKDAGMFADVVA